MKIHNFGLVVFGFGGFFGFTLFSAFILSSSNIYANEPAASASANAAVIVPDACTLSGTGMTSHNAEIANGTSNSNIGETTMKAYCNDNEGFAIYAIGYTDNTDGKNVLTNSTLGSTHDIATGTDTSGNSKWAMKVTTVSSPTPTYPITIENSFDSFHTVPDDYALVAKRTAGTDVGTNAEGSTLKTTYQAYISSTQLAATYTGQVKYVLVHPSTASEPVSDDQIGITFDGNGVNFASGSDRNRMVFGTTSVVDYYIGEPTILKTSNVTDENTYVPYDSVEDLLRVVSFNGAEKIKVVVKYGMTANTMGVAFAEGEWDGESDVEGDSVVFFSEDTNLSGTETHTFDGDTVTLSFAVWDDPEIGYDYGLYAQFYPIYDTEQPGTTAVYAYSIDSNPIRGAYATIPGQDELWYAIVDGKSYSFASESEVLAFVDENAEVLRGTTLNVYRSMSISEAFVRAGKTMVNGHYTIQDMDNVLCGSIKMGQNATLLDVRDNNTYMVEKLKDGNCWMLENLKLDPTDATTANNMNATNTNAPDTAITNYLNGGNVDNMPGWSSAGVSSFFDTDSETPSIYNVKKDTLVEAYGVAAVNGQAKNGVLYDFCAATVGTYCYYDGQGRDVPNTLVDAPYDICPVNWRLPTEGYGGEYNNLLDQYDTTVNATNSNSFQYNYSIALSGAMSGHYGFSYSDYWLGWSSTYSDDYQDGSINILEVSFNMIDQYAMNRDYGFAVRCLTGN